MGWSEGVRPFSEPVKLYGCKFPKGFSPLLVELLLFRDNWSPDKGGLGKAGHFWNVCDILWGPDNPRGKEFIRTPWAERMAEAASDHKYLAVAGCGSSGKCLNPATQVLRHDGTFVRAGDVKVGDLLMGENSSPRTVLSTTTGRAEMFRIVPGWGGGDPWECNADHVLTLKRARAGSRVKHKLGEVIDVPLKEFMTWSESARQEWQLFTAGVDFPEQPVEFDPRVYGMWLGDGCTVHPYITSPDSEPEVNEYFVGYFERLGYSVRKDKTSDGKCNMFYVKCPGVLSSPFKKFISGSVEVFDGKPRKRIRPEYLYNSRSVRMELLAGLLDTDGHSRGTNFEIACSVPGLSDQIVYLSRSLGFRTTKRREVTCHDAKGEPRETDRITIYGCAEIPTLRKKSRDSQFKTATQDCFRFSVEPLGVGDYAGFTLDGNGRFLLGDFTVTHNSDFFSVWAIVNYLSDPDHTQVLVTSTSLKESRKRVWGKVRDYWVALGPGFPGKLVDSNGVIRHLVKGETCGITLVAGEQKKEKEAMQKLMGIKSSRDNQGEARLFLIADELADLSPSIPNVAFANLSRATPNFQFIGIANPNSYYDPFGDFAQPKEGWESIHAEMDEWETRFGWCIRFDAHKSPNILEGKIIYPFLPKQSDLDEAAVTLGPDSQAYWRMLRGFWSPSGNAESVYSEADIVKFRAHSKAEWATPPTKIIAIDPAFTSGGDRSIAYIGNVGISKDGKKTLEFVRYVELRDSVQNKEEPRNFQIARQFVELCKDEGIDPKNAAIDTTGGGPVFADIVEHIWKSNAFLRVCFGGSPTDRPMSLANKAKAKDVCANKVTEIWVAGKELMRNEQIKGLGPDIIKELTARLYKDTKKSDGKAKVCVEAKKDMKARIGKSPDCADAGLLLCALARERHGLAAQKENGDSESGFGAKPQTWRRKLGKFNAYGRTNLMA